MRDLGHMKAFAKVDPCFDSTYNQKQVVASNFGSRVLPPRSMVGHLPLEQVIGVRIPGGQPKFAPSSAKTTVQIPLGIFSLLPL